MQFSRFYSLFAFAMIILPSACGSSPAVTDNAPMDHGAMDEMDHGTMDEMDAMDHGAMGDADTPYDAAFIDGMIVHHQGALDMASEALLLAERPELRELANEMSVSQLTEIERMQAWRAEWFPELGPTSGMAMDMGAMEVASGDTPYDQRFIEAMIPHHEGAIAMARDAIAQSERAEIRELAAEIIAAQETEITMMRAWLAEWYGQ